MKSIQGKVKKAIRPMKKDIVEGSEILVNGLLQTMNTNKLHELYSILKQASGNSRKLEAENVESKYIFIYKFTVYPVMKTEWQFR